MTAVLVGLALAVVVGRVLRRRHSSAAAAPAATVYVTPRAGRLSGRKDGLL